MNFRLSQPNKSVIEIIQQITLFNIVSDAKVVAYSEKSQERNESRQVQLIREYGFNPRSKVQVEDGALLPRKFEPFPDNMYGKPLEEIDQFIYEEVSKNLNQQIFLSCITDSCWIIRLKSSMLYILK